MFPRWDANRSWVVRNDHIKRPSSIILASIVICDDYPKWDTWAPW